MTTTMDTQFDVRPVLRRQIGRPTWVARTWIAVSDHRQATKSRKHDRKMQLAAARGSVHSTGWERLTSALLWLREFGLGLLSYAIILVVSYCGWSASFIGLHDFGVAHMGFTQETAWYVPGAIDGAAFGLTVVVAVESMRGRAAAQWRLLIAAFTALSSWVNWQHILDPTGRNVAALLPISAVILFEGLMYRARKAYEDRRNPGRQKPRIHILRWVFDFKGTLAIIRAHVLDIPLPEQFADAQQTIEQQRRRPQRKRRRSKTTPAAKNTTAQKATDATASDAETVAESTLESTQPLPRLVSVKNRNDALDDMTVTDLRTLAAENGVTVRGSKTDIITRLRNAGVTGDRNGASVTAQRYARDDQTVTATVTG